MSTTLTVVFDGVTLRPESTVDLVPDRRYEVTIREIDEPARPEPWPALRDFSGSIDDAPPDWSTETDHYVHGTPKRSSGNTP